MDNGSQLRQAREAKGLTLESLSRATRVQLRVLEAIERNSLTQLPPRPYGRGMVSAYAREVGLDPDVTVRDYFAEFNHTETAGPALPSRPAEAPRPLRFEEPGARFRSTALVIVAAVGVAGILMWGFSGSDGRDPRAVGTQGRIVPPSVATNDQAAAAPLTAAAPASPLTVVLEASRPSWVGASADGKRVVYRMMNEGERETLNGASTISIRVGDAGAMTWTVNGRGRAPMGASGEVRHVIVTPDNATTVR